MYLVINIIEYDVIYLFLDNAKNINFLGGIIFKLI